MTSQILAVFYLNDLDHFIKEELGIKYYVRYQDDGCLYHPSKEYLKYCLNKIEEFLKKEKLTLNRKTRIYKSTNNFIFLGRDTNGKYSKYRVVNRRIKNKLKLYEKREIKLSSLMATKRTYNHILKRKRIRF